MNETTIHRVETYFNRTMSDTDRVLFENEIGNNPELKEIYDEYKLAMEVVDQQVENNLYSKFASWKKEEKPDSKRIMRFAALAAGLALFIGIFFLINKSKPETHTELAMMYYKLPDSPEHTMGREVLHWQQGIDDYSKGLYEDAAKEWEKIENPGPEVNYYLAHSYFNLKRYEQAANLFRKITEGTSVYCFSADWYLIISLLSEGDIEQTNKYIDKILASKEHPFYSEASELKTKMTKFKSD